MQMVERSWTSKDFFAGSRLLDITTCSDGSRIAVVDRDREIRIYNRSGELLGRQSASRVARFESLDWIEMSVDSSTIVAGGHRRRGRIHAFDRDGGKLWERKLNLKRHCCTIASDGSRICIADGNDLCLFARNGNLEWRNTCPDRIADIDSSLNLSLIAVRTPQGLLVFDRQGNTIWEHGIEFSWFRHKVAADGSLVCATVSEKRLCAFSPEGELLWKHDASDLIAPRVISKDGRVVAVGSNDGHLVVLDSEGQLQFEHEEGGWVYPLKISGNGSTVVAGWNDNTLRAFDSTGKVLWEHVAGREIGTDVEIEVAVSEDGSIVVAALNDGNLMVFDREGRVLLEHAIGPYVIGPEISDDGSLIAVSPDERRLIVLDSQDM